MSLFIIETAFKASFILGVAARGQHAPAPEAVGRIETSGVDARGRGPAGTTDALRVAPALGHPDSGRHEGRRHRCPDRRAGRKRSVEFQSSSGRRSEPRLGGDAAAEPAVRTTRVAWVALLPVIYMAGVLLLLVRLLRERLIVSRLARRAVDIANPEWTRLLAECAEQIGVRRPVRLLRSLERSMPMAFGIGRPSILIPSLADMWSEDRRRAVLLHELAHIARHDCLTQLMAATACAVYWIHPGVWWVARRLRVERELACDDRVVRAGAHAREYAEHLLELPTRSAAIARPRLSSRWRASDRSKGACSRCSMPRVIGPPRRGGAAWPASR